MNQTGRKAPTSYSHLYHNPSFIRLWIGQTISFIGDYFYFLAIPILVNRLTGSTLMVGLSVISSALPMLLLGPIAGVFVDRWNRKWTMIVSDVLRALLVLLCLLVTRREQVWIYYLVGFLMSCVSRFFFPSQNAVLPTIVSDETDLLAANGLMQIVQTVGLLAGPALAGFTIGLWGAWVAFVFDSASFFFSAAAILTMVIPDTRQSVLTSSRINIKAIWAEMKDGMSFLFGSQVLLTMMISLAIVHLSLGAINVVWVPYIQSTFGIGPEGLGIVDSAQGVGMVIGGLGLGILAARMKIITMAASGLVFIGVFLSCMGLAPAFVYVLFASVGLGIALIPAQSALMTTLQISVPDRKRGRVGSAVNAVGTAVGLISMATVSLIGESIGLRNVYILGGLIVVSAGILSKIIGKEPELVSTATVKQ